MILSSGSLYAPSVAESVGRDCKENILSFPLSAAPLVAIRAITTDEETAMGTNHGAVGREC